MEEGRCYVVFLHCADGQLAEREETINGCHIDYVIAITRVRRNNAILPTWVLQLWRTVMGNFYPNPNVVFL